MPEGAAEDLAPVAAHHVEARAPVAPPLDGAALDPEVVHARELDAVPVPSRPDVPDYQPPQEDVVGGAVVGAAVVDVEAVAPDPGHDQVVQLDVGGVGQVEAGVIP